MKLSSALRLPDLPRLALVGAGGKSSALFWLGRELAEIHRTVILTTTTHLGTWQVNGGDDHVVIHTAQDLEQPPEFQSGVIIVSGPLHDAQRYGGFNADALARLQLLADAQRMPLLIEADGARLLPLKAPAEHEPAIPGFVETVVVCMGMQGLGKPLNSEWVHRPELFGRLAGLEAGEPITPEAVSRVVVHPLGGLKNMPAAARRILLLNQADSVERQAQANAIARQTQQAYHSVVIAALPRLSVESTSMGESEKQQVVIHAVHAPIAGIILAAGGAKRFGKLKQLLAWEGQSLVCRAAQTALQAGLSPVIVVTGAGADQVSQAVMGLPVRVVNNPQWQDGQSTSMQAGLIALAPTSGGAVFLLADQPNIPAVLIQALVETHSQSLAAVVAPMIDGQRGNPVLFDPVTYEDLKLVRGDVGGKQIFSKFPVRYVPWHDRAALLDIDEPNDYEMQRP